MTWHDISNDLAMLWDLLCLLIRGVEWIAVRAAFVLCLVALPILVIAFVVSACYLQRRSDQANMK